MPFNPSQFVTQVRPFEQPDFGKLFRDFAAQELEKKRVADQESQFQQTNTRLQDYGNRQLNLQSQEEQNKNVRFATEASNKANEENYKLDQAKYQQLTKLASDTRGLIAKGKWNEAYSNLGTLKDLGANVNVATDEKGMPVFDIQVPEYKGTKLEADYNTIQGRFNNPSQSQNQQTVTKPQDSPLFTAKNPFETQLGTASDSVTGQPGKDSGVAEPEHNGKLPGNTNATQAPVQAEESGAPKLNQMNPNQLSTSFLSNMTSQRLNPILSGIQNAIPERFRGEAGNLINSFSSLGAPPEDTLKAMQKPLDTAAGLYRGQMAAESANARASMSEGGHESTEARQRENAATALVDKKAKEFGLNDAVSNNLEADDIMRKISSGNPQAQVDGVKQLIAMHEGHRISDKDFELAAKGMPSKAEDLQLWVQGLYTSGLKASQKEGFLKMLQMSKLNNQTKIKNAQKQLKNFATKGFRYAPERYAAYKYIVGSVPEDSLDPEIMNWDPTQDSLGGVQVGGGGTKKKASKSVSSKGGADTTELSNDVNKDLEEFQ